MTKKGTGWLRCRKVEAAGIEPASRDISMPASTCVVVYLSLVRESPSDRLLDGPAGNIFLAVSVLGMTDGEPDLATNFWDSPTKARSRGYLSLGGQYEVFLGK
jgi:hypothetical protein